MGNESLAALLKNKESHQRILVKSVAIAIALLLMTSFLYSAAAQVTPVRHNIRGNGIEVGFTEYDPMNWCPYTDFFLYAYNTVEKIAPLNPGKPVPAKWGYLYLYTDDCDNWAEGYSELLSFELEVATARLASASFQATATVFYYEEVTVCYYFPPYGWFCYTTYEETEDDVTINIVLTGSGEIHHENRTIHTNFSNLKWRAHLNGLYRPSSASIEIIGEKTNIQKEITYPPPTPPTPEDPYIWDYAQIIKINAGDTTLLRP